MPTPRIAAPLWGPSYGADEIEKALSARNNVQAVAYDSFSGLAAAAAERLANGQIMGWFQGALEKDVCRLWYEHELLVMKGTEEGCHL